MAFISVNGAQASADVGSSGLVEYGSGDSLDDAVLNAANQDLQAAAMYAMLPGVLSGGVCTAAAALVVTIPIGTRFFARNVWQNATAYTISVPDATTSSVWGCADGVIRLGATSTTAPTGWTSGLDCCLLTTATATGGSASVDNTTQHKGRYHTGRVVFDGPLTLNYATGAMGLFGSPGTTKVSVADPAALTSTGAAGSTPTQAEFNALFADVTAVRTKLAALLDALQGYGAV